MPWNVEYLESFGNFPLTCGQDLDTLIATGEQPYLGTLFGGVSSPIQESQMKYPLVKTNVKMEIQ